MSTVLAMRLNESQALLVADESTWHLGAVLGYRRTNYGDALSVLVEPQETARTGISAVYAGIGFPSFHHEVARRARVLLAGAADADGARIGRLVHAAYLATHERMLDDKLRFNYGFGRDTLNSRVYNRDGRKLELGSELVAEAARTIAAGNARANAYARIFQNGGLVVTHDKAHGIRCFYLDRAACALGFATPIAVLGEGDEVSTHLLARFVQRRDLGERRRGFSSTEGLYIGMSVATEIRTSVGKMGGYFQIVFIDGAKGAREIVTDAAHLASEVMRAHHWGFISRRDAEELTTALVIENAEFSDVEARMFRRASDPDKLKRYLMGFKPAQAPVALELDPPAELPESRAAGDDEAREQSPPDRVARASRQPTAGARGKLGRAESGPRGGPRSRRKGGELQ